MELTGLSYTGEKKNTKRILHLKDEIIKDTNRVEIVQTPLQRLESSRGLQDLLGREKDAIRTQQAARMLELEKKLVEYREKYGVFPGGEKAAREVLLPKKSGENEKISQTVRTILETKATPEEMVPDIMELAMEVKYSCEEASREVVADAMADILPDSHFVENLYQKNQNLFVRVLNKLKEFVKNVREYFAHVNPNTKLEAAVLKENTESGMWYLEKIVEAFDKTAEAAVENYQQAANVTESTAEGRTQYKTRGKYWRPDLKGSEWQLLERRMAEEIGSRENFLDEATKWVYANEKGVQVFALYGIGDGTDATPLYAVGGKQAVSAAADIRKFENGGYRYDGNTETALSWIRSVSRTQGDGGGDIREASRGGSAGTDDALYGGERKGNAGGAAERGSENQRGVKEKFSLRDSTGRELQGIWDNALMDAARNNRGTVEKAAPTESRRQAQAESGESIKPGEKPLMKGKRDDDKIGTVNTSLKEDLDNGKARKEDRGAFLRRSVEDGYQVFEGKSAAYGYRSVRRESARENARQIQEELTELGIDAEIIDGDILWNLDGISSARRVPQATTVEKNKVMVSTDASLAPRNTAGHEAFHLWHGLSVRKAFEDVVTDNLIFSSEEFLEYQSVISKAYLGDEADLSDEAQYTKLTEEIIAYISGDIHEGVNDDLLRPMFHDYDAVKAAWVKLCKDNSGGEVRFSVREVGGETMPVLDIQNDTRDYKVAEAYLKTLVDTEHPFATILVDAQPVYIGKDLPGEYKGSEYTHGLNSSTRQVKMQAATNLDEMLLLAENGEWRDNVKEKHKQDAKNGWYRYSTRFALPVLDIKKAVDHYTVYSGTLLIRNDADGKSYLYDLLDIKKEKVISSPSFSARERSEVFEPKPSQEQYMQNSRESQAEKTGNDRHALRDVAMSDRKMNFTQADRERLKIFKKRLDILDEKQTQRQGYLQAKRDILSNSARLF